MIFAFRTLLVVGQRYADKRLHPIINGRVECHTVPFTVLRQVERTHWAEDVRLEYGLSDAEVEEAQHNHERNGFKFYYDLSVD